MNPVKLSIDAVRAGTKFRQLVSESPRRSAAQSALSSRIWNDGNTSRFMMRRSTSVHGASRLSESQRQAVQSQRSGWTSAATNWAKSRTLQPMRACVKRYQRVQLVQVIVVSLRRLLANTSLNRTVCGGSALGFISFSPKANPPQTAG